MGDNLSAGVEFVNALRQVAERDEISVQITDLVFVRLAYIEDEKIFLRIELLFQLLHRYCRHIRRDGCFLPADSAELVVVDELFHRRILSTGRAVRALAQLQFPELHAERIYQQKPADEWIALA